jgi:Bacterial type II/III secretion system short domain
MRTWFILFLFLCCGVVRAQVTEDPFGKDVKKAANELKKSLLEVIPLKYADSSMVATVVSDLGIEGTMRMSADPRTNSIIVLAEEGTIKKIKGYIRTLDVSGKEEETTLLFPSEFLKYDSHDGDIVQQISKTTDVQVAVDKDLGLIMIQGSKENVERTTAILERIEELAESKNIESLKAEQQQSGERAIRVFWLSNDPTQDSRNPMQPDAALQKSIEKLAELGFAGMTIKMQLLGRCDINQGKAQSRVQGSIASGNTHRTLNAEAILSVANGSSINGKFRLEAGVSDVRSASPRAGDEVATDRASVEVDINLEPNKYYILSASPIGGFQTAFVVQLIDGL